MKVHILSLLEFKDLIKKPLNPNYCYISILDPDDKIPLEEDSKNYKTFWFYDLEYDVSTYKAFTSDQAGEMFDFIEQNKGCEKFIVHCTAGVSRSGAVGEFIHEMFGGSYKELIEQFHILPSGRVLMYLRYAQENRKSKEITF